MLATVNGVAYLTLLFSSDFDNWGLGLISNIILETSSGENAYHWRLLPMYYGRSGGFL